MEIIFFKIESFYHSTFDALQDIGKLLQLAIIPYIQVHGVALFI